MRSIADYLQDHFGDAPSREPEEDHDGDYYVRWVEHNLNQGPSGHRLEHLREFLRMMDRKTKDRPDGITLHEWHGLNLACRFRTSDGTMFATKLREIARGLPKPDTSEEMELYSLLPSLYKVERAEDGAPRIVIHAAVIKDAAAVLMKVETPFKSNQHVKANGWIKDTKRVKLDGLTWKQLHAARKKVASSAAQPSIADDELIARVAEHWSEVLHGSD